MITGIIRVSYLNAFEAKENQSGVLKFSTCVLIPKSDKAGLAAINAEIEKAVALGIKKGKFTLAQTKSTKFKSPMRDGDKELATEDRKGSEYEDHMFFNCANNSQPGIVGRNGEPIIDSSQVYSGMYARIDAGFFPFNTNGSLGIAVGFNNLMKWEDGERLDGRQSAEDAFADLAEKFDDATEDMQ